MNPDLLLDIVAALVGFALKTTVGFGICLALSRLVGSPSRRFLVWLSFLFGAAAYWLWLAEGIAAGRWPSASAPAALIQPLGSTARSLQVPSSWVSPLSVALLVVGIVYLLALSYVLLTHLKRHRQLKWILGFTSQPPGEIAKIFQALAQRLHVGRSRLLVLPGIDSPATFGWIRPIILLPDVCLEQEHSELKNILSHELHHVRRWDFVWNGFASVSRALLLFHPAAWYAARRMQLDRELACDLAVVSDSPEEKVNYAECLLRFARLHSSQDPNWGMDFAASSEHLKARVQSILAEDRKPSSWSVGLRTAGGLGLLLGLLVIEPSLGVFLSYATQHMSQPVTAEIHTRVDTRPTAKTHKQFKVAAPAALDPVDASGSVEDSMSSELRPEVPSSAESARGRQLLHRPSTVPGEPSASLKQRTVVLIDPSSEVNKDGKRAVAQSAALAAAIYKSTSDFDRH